MADAQVFVVGSLNADHRVRVARLPRSGETVLGNEVIVAAGGKGANQAVAAARAGARTRIVGAVGDDHDGAVVRHALGGDTVDTAHLHIVTTAATGRALITVDEDGENTIVVSPGANGELTRDDVSAGLDGIGPGSLLLLQLETPMPLVVHAARTARAAGATVVVNAAPVPDDVHGLLGLADLLVVNEHELGRIADALGRERGPGDMAVVAAASGARVVCTAGSAGAFTTVGEHTAHVQAPAVSAVDTTAAGDTFIGYLAAGLADDPDDVLAAMEFAVRAAGMAVTRPGAIDSIPHHTEITAAATHLDAKDRP